MAWPLSQDYNEAIQSPASSFRDAELRQGEAVTNALGLPVPRSGNFADVYELKCPGGKRYAVKCFTRQIPGLAERYQQVSAHLKQNPLPFMVDFTFLEQGVRVRGAWYPVLKMAWVEGFTLNDFIRKQLDKPQVLDLMSQIWVKMAAKLRGAQIAHCDLQHGNVLLVPGSKAGSLAVKLVDYDGMCVPALSLLKTIEVGHPNYQHPQRLREGLYDLTIDRFSHLVIYTSLRALRIGGEQLWERYDNGDNFLFKEADLQDPSRSPLFQELFTLNDPSVNRLAQALAEACTQPLARSPLLDELVMPASSSVTVASPSAPDEAGAGDMWATMVTPNNGAEERTGGKRGPKRLLVWAAAGVLGLLGLVGVTVAFLSARGSQQSRPNSGVAQAGSEAPTLTSVKNLLPRRETRPEPKKDPVPPQQVKQLTTTPPTPGGMLVNSLGMTFARIPAGKFSMGAPTGEAGRTETEGPPHEVAITAPFYLGIYEVAQAQYEQVVGKNPSFFKNEGGSEHPVENVSWYDADAFCRQLSERPEEKQARRRYRLPTEAEWEYACRAGTATVFHLGDSLSSARGNIDGKSPYGGATLGPSVSRTARVGSYPPNAFGLYDMHGNVWEWCQDWFAPYEVTWATDPEGPASGEEKVIRGGSWKSGGEFCRSAHRGSLRPDRGGNVHGFRIVCDTGARGRLFRTPLAGGGGGGPFEVLSKGRGPVVGFVVTSGKFNGAHVVKSVQPIYQTPEGRKMGETVGEPGGQTVRLEAKDGYAVGGLITRYGFYVDGFKVVFMRLNGDRLNSKDAYESEYVGGPGGVDRALSGEGKLIIGIHGRSARIVDALGLVQQDSGN